MYSITQPYTAKQRRALWRASALGLCLVVGFVANFLHSFEAHVYCPIHSTTEHVEAGDDHHRSKHPNSDNSGGSDFPHFERLATSEAALDHATCFQEWAPHKRANISTSEKIAVSGFHKASVAIVSLFTLPALFRLAPKGSPPKLV